MSGIKGHVGSWNLSFRSVPRGRSGMVEVEVPGHGVLSVRWRRDGDGIWIELPSGTYGFDFDGERNDEGRVLYRVSQRGFATEWSGISFMRAGDDAGLVAAAGTKKKGMRVRAQMPGKIIRIFGREGAVVEKDQPVAVMEAMKMENEIRAPAAGKLSKVSVNEGQAVETGAELFTIDAE